MTEVELWCAVYGDGAVFPVKVPLDANVSALQEAVVNKVNDRFKVDPSKLTLYLARKQGSWLTDGQNVKDLLRRDVDTAYKEIHSTRTLDDEEYFGKNFEPGDEEIHVLVELPKATVGSSSEQSASYKMIKDIYERVVLTKRKRYIHSEMTIEKGRQLLQELDIKVEVEHSVPFATEDLTPVEEFNWESSSGEHDRGLPPSEKQQRKRYRAYVEENIGSVLSESNLCVFSVGEKEILNTRIPGHRIELVGRTDLLILSDIVQDFPHDVHFFPDVRMLIEVQREIKEGAVFQALSELIALSVLAKDPVMALLTDMNHNWQFFWVSEERIHKVNIRNRCEAFQMIRVLLEQPPTTNADICVPCIGVPVKRRKVIQLLSAGREDSESGGCRKTI